MFSWEGGTCLSQVLGEQWSAHMSATHCVECSPTFCPTAEESGCADLYRQQV